MTRKSLLVILGVLLLHTSALAEEVSGYKANITRNNVTAPRLIYNVWSGEYPSPVIDVQAHKKGTTKIKAYKSLRSLDEPLSCTIKNGLYHPWSNTKASLRDYYTVTDVADYEAIRQVTLDVTVQPGTQLVNAEGLCKGTLQSKTRKQQPISFPCDVVDESEQFKKLALNTVHLHEQWLYLSCSEGYAAFVRDEELLKQPGIKVGRIVSYGTVQGAGTE